MGIGAKESSALANLPESSSSKDSKSSDVSPSATRKPPPETAKSARTRIQVIASFWVVVLFLGLPVWWWTTSIHRARLPLQEMLEWADGKACKPTFPLHIVIDAPTVQKSEAEHLVRATQHALDDLNEFSAHHLRLTLGESVLESSSEVQETQGANDVQKEQERAEPPALTVKLAQVDNKQPPSTELQPHSAVLNVVYGASQKPSSSSSSSVLATMIAKKLQELFSEEQASIAYTLIAKGGSSTNTALGQSQGTSGAQRGLSRVLSPEMSAKLAQRETRAFKYAPNYHVTISLFTPTGLPSSWNVQSAIREYLDPLLQSFSISNFTVTTQVQLYATFSPSVQKPEYDPDHKVWTLRNEDLSAFVNAAEWPLGPSIGDGPTINFILYVPDENTSPLVVKDGQASSWLIPQWGGVSILNPKQASSVSKSLSKEELQPAMLTFSHQLLSLLGSPDSPSSLALKLQSLTRLQAASLILSASSTMGSLARLTSALPGIPIPENVANGVDSVLAHLDSACTDLREGRFTGALENARIAETEAEKAFFDKSMVGQVYFPDEHKVAVYLPLLGPIGVPLVMSALKEIKKVIRKS